MTIETEDHRWLERFPNTSDSARVILPIVFEMLDQPRSIVDLGGGIGAWCQVALELGVDTVNCVDHPDTCEQGLLVPADSFVPCDFSSRLPPPILCDLAMSLEVGEHIPTAMSRPFVEFLTASAPVVLFSSSIPGQPGVSHINEQPPVFWERIFSEFGFQRWDLVRPRIIAETAIPYWYRQNCFLFAGPEVSERLKSVDGSYPAIADDFELIHNRIAGIYRASATTPSVKRWMRTLPKVVKQALERRLPNSAIGAQERD